MSEPATAIVDIGSNSIRLVVYSGPARLPAVVFNEKVLAGLGRGVAATGAIDAAAMALAARSLARFARLAREMSVGQIRTVATAAVRDAANGGELIALAAERGLHVELLSGEDEAVASGHGALSAIPDADGIVGDLGGGSLELVRVAGGAVTERASFPLGVLRLPAIRGTLAATVRQLLGDAGWGGRGRGRPFYLVGGSWRTLARLDMVLGDHPLAVIHGHAMSRATVERLARTVPSTPKAELKEVPGLSSGRIPTLGDAAALLGVAMEELRASEAVASAFGLREGLLYGALGTETRALDPLIVATRDEGRRSGRFAEHGTLLDAWIAPLFADDPAEAARLRAAACHLADVGWRANPEFRAERGVEIALHGNWVAIDAAGRARVAQALWTSLGGAGSPEPLGRLADADALAQATRWGLAMRLGQRLSGGLEGPLARSRLSVEGGALRLWLEGDDRELYGETVGKRHAALAAAMGLGVDCSFHRSS